MERKLETIKGRMKWFLGFINSKIKDLSNQDLFRLWNEIREIAFGEMGRYAIRDRRLRRLRMPNKPPKPASMPNPTPAAVGSGTGTIGCAAGIAPPTSAMLKLCVSSQLIKAYTGASNVDASFLSAHASYAQSLACRISAAVAFGTP